MTTAFSNYIGIDVSKDKIDVFSTEKLSRFTVKNTKKQIRQALYGFDRKDTLVVLENTGGYERTCVDTLQKIGYTIHRTNNNKVKNFMRYQGIKAKTDKIDAEVLANYGRLTENLTVHQQPSEAFEKLKETSLFIETLKKFRVVLKNKSQNPSCNLIKDVINDMISYCSNKIDELENCSNDLLKQDKELFDKVKLIQQYKGIGQTTARNLIVFLPELGKLTAKEICSLAGLAPYPRDSGKKQGRRSIGLGRPIVRRILYMAILSALRYNKNISTFYNKKLTQGKIKMIAVVACMRKMLIHLNAILKKGVMNF